MQFNAIKIKQWLLTSQGMWVLFISWALFVSNLWLPRNWGFYGHHDWDLTYATFEAARKSIIEYGQWPIFNPYSAFGTDTVANPQAVNGGIFFIPVLIFGTFYGYKLSLLSAIIIGAWGSFKCFNLINKDKQMALFGALLFAGCSFFSRHLFEAGHSNVMYLYLLPWIIFWLQKCLEKINFKRLILPVFLLSQMLTGGAPIVFITSCILILLWGIGLWLVEKKGLKTLLFFTFIIIGSFAISLWKMWPVMQYWQHTPRLIKDDSGINFLIWLQALSDYETDTRTWHNWFEFSLGFNVILLGIIIFYRKQIVHFKYWLLLLIPLLWLCMGNMPEYFNPWYVLNTYFPIFNSLRAPYRFGILLVFVLCVSLVNVIKYQQKNELLTMVLFFAVIAQTLSYNAISKKFTNSKRLEEYQIIKNTKAQPIKVSNEESKQQFLLIQQNYLIQNAYEPLYLSVVKDSTIDLVKGAELTYFSPNVLKLNQCDSIVNINLRYNQFWQIKGSGKITNNNGSISIKNAKDTIELCYFNTDIILGIWLSIIALVIIIILNLFFKNIF